MSVVTLRPGDRLQNMVELQHLASRLWPAGGHHPGGLGWALGIDELYPQLELASEGANLVGWAGASTGAIEVHVDAASPDAAPTLLEWALDAAGGPGEEAGISVPLFDGDRALQPAIAAAGFAADHTQPPLYGMFHDAIPVAPAPPPGYHIRGLAPGEEQVRVDAHRAAWRPATLPWPADVLGTVSPDLTSSFAWEHFEAVRRAWLYEPELDLVVEGPEGTLVGCCTVWWDPQLDVAEIEPLGIDPAHRHRGLATALCLTASALVAARGGHQVFINTGPRDDYPAPAATYTAAGFAAIKRGTIWSKRPG